MKKRTKRKETTLFFDSFKHFKNNFSNLICFELITLMDSDDVEKYLHMKSVNYKSKYPDMKKLGLINYEKPSDNIFELTEQGIKIYNILEEKKNHFIYELDGQRLESITPQQLWEVLDPIEKEEIMEQLIILLVSYYDSADSLRPYLSLIKIIENYSIEKLDHEILCNILAQTKEDILLKNIKENAFTILNSDVQNELKRPISYLINGLQTAGIIDANCFVIYDREFVKEIVMNLNEIYVSAESSSFDAVGRSATEQKSFRDLVLKAYGYKCAITGQCIEIINNDNSTQYLLDAAHIIPYSESGSFSVNNGIAMSFEMHKMFDRKLFAFDYNKEGELEVIVTSNNKVKDDEILSKINHKVLRLPIKESDFPDMAAISYRKEQHLL